MKPPEKTKIPPVIMKCCLGYSECDDSNKTLVFSLGNLPLGNPVPNEREVWSAEFELRKCQRCDFMQTVDKVPFDKLAEENFYVSSVSDSVIDHYKWMCGYIQRFEEIDKNDLILEIGCGDGALLNMLHDAGYSNLIGVEPNEYQVTSDKYELINDFFNELVALDLKRHNKSPKLVILNSVIETIPNLERFFHDFFAFLPPGALFFIEVPHFNAYLENLRIDAFSHLTSNWFTVSFFQHMAKRFNAEILDVSIDSYRGGSIYLMAKARNSESVGFGPRESVKEIIDEEKFMLSEDYFAVFRSKLTNIKAELSARLAQFKLQGFILCGYGGGLKASTLLNWLEAGVLDFVVDKDPCKIGKFIPRVNLPILNVDDLKIPDKPVVVINLAINFSDEVEKILKEILKRGDKIVHLLPEIKTIELS